MHAWSIEIAAFTKPVQNFGLVWMRALAAACRHESWISRRRDLATRACQGAALPRQARSAGHRCTGRCSRGHAELCQLSRRDLARRVCVVGRAQALAGAAARAISSAPRVARRPRRSHGSEPIPDHEPARRRVVGGARDRVALERGRVLVARRPVSARDREGPRPQPAHDEVSPRTRPRAAQGAPARAGPARARGLPQLRRGSCSGS